MEIKKFCQKLLAKSNMLENIHEAKLLQPITAFKKAKNFQNFFLFYMKPKSSARV